MFSLQTELLARARIADMRRAAEPRFGFRGSLQVMLDARRARQRSLSR